MPWPYVPALCIIRIDMAFLLEVQSILTARDTHNIVDDRRVFRNSMMPCTSFCTNDGSSSKIDVSAFAPLEIFREDIYTVKAR